MKLLYLLVALALLAISAGNANAIELTNGRITVEFAVASPSEGITSADKDRIDSISWTSSDGENTGNLTSNFQEVFCGDNNWNFGDSYGETEGTGIFADFGGEVATAYPIESGLSGATKSNGVMSCGRQWSASTETSYVLGTRASVANVMKITRKFTFLPYIQGEAAQNLRSFVPRLALDTYNYVLLPETDGTIHTYNADSCGSACDLPSSWTGSWFADDDGNGDGMMMIRDPSDSWPAVVAMDNDGGAPNTGGANATSISLVYPAGGWAGTITEIQWLCFYDRFTWTAVDTAAGKLPMGCRVPME